MNLLFLYSKLIKKLHGKCIKDSQCHKTATVYSASDVYYSTIGRYSYVGCDCKVIRTDVGNFCSISNHVVIGVDEHPLAWASTSPVFQGIKNSGSAVRFADFPLPQTARTKIGHDVWIGEGAAVKAGVAIGNGAVVGSGAVDPKDVPDYAIFGGVPARIIRYRFDEQTITALNETAWWNLSDDQLHQVGQYIREPKEFINQVKQLKEIET